MPANFNQSIVAEYVSAVSVDPDDFTMIRRATVFDVFARANGAAAGTCRVQKSATAITDAISVNAGVNTLTRAATIDQGVNTLLVGEVLRVVKSAAVSTTTSIYLAAPGVTA